MTTTNKISVEDLIIFDLKSSNEVGIRTDGNFPVYTSPLIGLVCTISKLNGKNEFTKQLVSLSLSYFNHKNSVINSYANIFSISQKIKNESDHFALIHIGSELINSFIVNIKASFDIICCILQILENKQAIEEHKYTDINKYTNQRFNSDLKLIIKNIKDQSWFNELIDIRNKIIHRGYKTEFFIQRILNQNTYNYSEHTQIRLTLPKLFENLEHSGLNSFDLRCYYKKIEISKYIQEFMKLETCESQLADKLIELEMTFGIITYSPSHCDNFGNLTLN
jgi:disulfide oxidoreductase YuzD